MLKGQVRCLPFYFWPDDILNLAENGTTIHKKLQHLLADAVCPMAKGVARLSHFLLHFNDGVIDRTVFDALAPAGGIAF